MRRPSLKFLFGTVVCLLAVNLIFFTIPSSGRAAYSLDVDVYTVGSNPAGHALDPGGNNIGGVPSISWDFNVPSAGNALLRILAEGVDGGSNAPGGGEFDSVYLNGSFLGYLTQQNFYSPDFNLQPGPGALAGITAEVNSFFDVFVDAGINTVRIDVDPANWVNEIETSTLSSRVPEPTTLLLLAIGVLGICGARRKLNR